VYNQKEGQADPDLANKAFRFYKRWFEDKGATVIQKANM
jgi:hypothetical protein